MCKMLFDKVKRFFSMRSVLPFMFALILFAQSAVILSFGEKKEGFHIDGLLAFGCANSHNFAFLNSQLDFLNQWHDREQNYYRDYVTVQQGEQFSYSSVYRNLAQDNHPPLYFFMLHTICSFFPDQISKWMVVVPNLLFTLLTVWILYKIGCLLMKSKWLALLPTAFWGFSAATIGMAVFARMYALLTLFATLLVYLHIVFLFQDQTPRPCWIFPAMLAVTFLGIMTQYYFLIFCFFLCGLTFVWLFLSRQYKQLAYYCAAELGGLLCSILFFPHMISRIFFIDRGKQAVSALKDFSDFESKIIQYLTQIGGQLFDGFLFELAIILGLLLLVVLVRTFFVKISADQAHPQTVKLDIQFFPKRSVSLKITREDGVLVGLLCVAAGYLMIIAKIAPYQSLRYFACVTPIMMLCFFVGALWVFKFYRHAKAYLVILCLVIGMLTVGSYDNRVENLFIGEAQRNELTNLHREYPAVAIFKEPWRSASDILNFSKYRSVLNLKSDNLQMLDDPVTEERVQGGMVLYLEKQIDDDAFRDQIAGKFALSSTQKLYSNAYLNVYVLSPGDQAVTADGDQSNE